MLFEIDPIFFNNQWSFQHTHIHQTDIFTYNSDKKKLNRREEKHTNNDRSNPDGEQIPKENFPYKKTKSKD